MKRACVAGASGYLGSYLVRELKKQGYWVRVLTRSRERLGDTSRIADETVVAEVTDPTTLNGVCRDIDVLLSTVGITKQKDGLTFTDVDYQANMNLLDEARSNGVKKFIYVSVFNAGKMRHLKSVQAKLRFGEALMDAGLDYSIIYPNGFFSDMREYLTMAQKGRGYVFGSGENRINPIDGADLAEVCVSAIPSHAREIHVGGPDILTHNDILHLAFNALGKHAKITRVPRWLSSGMLSVLRACTPARIHGPIEFFTTVLSWDMIAPAYGSRRLQEFFRETAGHAEDTLTNRETEYTEHSAMEN